MFPKILVLPKMSILGYAFALHPLPKIARNSPRLDDPRDVTSVIPTPVPATITHGPGIDTLLTTLQLSSEEDIECLGKLASLISLCDRLSSPPPTSPLIHRINLSPPPVHIPPPIPNDIHFRKTKLLNRIKEYYVMMDATRLRLDPIAKKLIEDDERQHLGLEVKVPREVRDKTWEVIEKFNEYYEKLDTVGHKMTNKKWRLLKKAVKAIGGVSFTDLDSNLHSKMSYEPYQSNVSLEDFDNWAAAISEGVDFRNLGFDPSNPNPLVAFEQLFRNAHTITSANVKHYVDQHVAGLTQKINEELHQFG
ncbi:hypothetical protein VKT23_012208 [Stygiomarasmius scandens]|uniref:Uncharacterized protein n=1 Tax=Marasmiellus scandens TaxID=2682957 RepID=A0ABR1JB91_9AGAR